mmetsp:Transcript_1578/g.5966  ORF Transcript_1578/g.5966 Transcript_1578/m.5966 type:complete len:114 (+) Transcript_1578:1663-2004(+)
MGSSSNIGHSDSSRRRSALRPSLRRCTSLPEERTGLHLRRRGTSSALGHLARELQLAIDVQRAVPEEYTALFALLGSVHEILPQIPTMAVLVPRFMLHLSECFEEPPCGWTLT